MMPSLRDISIKHKLTMIIMLTAVIVLILSSVSFMANDVMTFRKGMVDNLSTLANIIGSNSTAALTFNDRDSAEETLSALDDEPHIVSACIYQIDGKKFADYIRKEAGEDLSPPGPEEDGYRFKDDHLILFQKIKLDEETIGTIYLQSDLEGMYSRLKKYIGIVAFIMMFVSVVAFLLSSTSQRVISEPILRLAQTARAISRERNYAIRAEKLSGDELGDLIDDFNEMLAQIQDRDARLELHRNRLEEVVSERTAELLKANKELLMEMADRRRAEEEQKKLSARLQRAEKMEALGTLAGGVAHDLNNILTGIVSYPELLLLDLPEDSPQRDPILTIQNSGLRAAAIVQDLLTLARRGVAVTEILKLNDLVEEYLSSPEHEKLRSFHAGVQFEADLDSDLLNIMGSPVHLSKTIMNLVSNAAEALPDGGQVTITTKNGYIDRSIKGYDEVKEGDYVILSVVDNGIGISDMDLEKIFEPFYTKKKMGRSGTGLGMAVVWGTVKDHRGYIDVGSQTGEGSTFDLYFPVTRKQAEKEMRKVSIEELSGNGEKILVVDDVKEQRQIAAMLLTRFGYAVDTVSSGEEALEYMKTNSADLLLLDMIMEPGIDGLDTYRRMLELRPGIKAVIASGFSETDRVREVQRLGAGKYVKKPYTIEKIGTAVKAELQRKV